MAEELTEAEEQLVADLAGEFCEKWRADEEVQKQTYLDKLPNERCRTAFLEAVNMNILLVLNEDLKALMGKAGKN